MTGGKGAETKAEGVAASPNSTPSSVSPRSPSFMRWLKSTSTSSSPSAKRSNRSSSVSDSKDATLHNKTEKASSKSRKSPSKWLPNLSKTTKSTSSKRNSQARQIHEGEGAGGIEQSLAYHSGSSQPQKENDRQEQIWSPSLPSSAVAGGARSLKSPNNTFASNTPESDIAALSRENDPPLIAIDEIAPSNGHASESETIKQYHSEAIHANDDESSSPSASVTDPMDHQHIQFNSYDSDDGNGDAKFQNGNATYPDAETSPSVPHADFPQREDFPEGESSNDPLSSTVGNIAREARQPTTSTIPTEIITIIDYIDAATADTHPSKSKRNEDALSQAKQQSDRNQRLGSTAFKHDTEKLTSLGSFHDDAVIKHTISMNDTLTTSDNEEVQKRLIHASMLIQAYKDKLEQSENAIAALNKDMQLARKSIHHIARRNASLYKRWKRSDESLQRLQTETIPKKSVGRASLLITPLFLFIVGGLAYCVATICLMYVAVELDSMFFGGNAHTYSTSDSGDGGKRDNRTDDDGDDDEAKDADADADDSSTKKMKGPNQNFLSEGGILKSSSFRVSKSK
eukprot:CAMPEP_0119545570 /NCGR_PEP_ID=MMETSP1352-20130426/277_1 /TAXON_ID=265584 /ORGANISM="Stauroneis constricta, Strain CCMP1120" /LENGTH=570 /DNA_ID=CAMNT_0007590127 /DNA_START=246 /DNA_END=1958 /DNA_ORIENTATION=+